MITLMRFGPLMLIVGLILLFELRLGVEPKSTEVFEIDPVVRVNPESIPKTPVLKSKPQVSPVETSKRRFSKYELECLAVNIFHEARGESREGKLAVALVTYNRYKSKKYPGSICSVVYQPYQFSWTTDKPKIRDWKTYNKIKELAEYFLNDYIYNHEDFTNGSKYYHATWIKTPYWASSFKQTAHIGDHVFYRSDEG